MRPGSSEHLSEEFRRIHRWNYFRFPGALRLEKMEQLQNHLESWLGASAAMRANTYNRGDVVDQWTRYGVYERAAGMLESARSQAEARDLVESLEGRMRHAEYQVYSLLAKYRNRSQVGVREQLRIAYANFSALEHVFATFSLRHGLPRNPVYPPLF